MGGDGPTVFDRVLAFGDAAMPNYAPDGILERALDGFESAIAEFTGG